MDEYGRHKGGDRNQRISFLNPFLPVIFPVIIMY